MGNAPNNKTRKRSIRSKITRYIIKKHDICCEKDIDRNIVIKEIFAKYKEQARFLNEEGEYLNYINNDLIVFIGYKVDLEKNKDEEGLKLWMELDRRMYKDNRISSSKIIKLLHKVPLYYLMSFLGLATYKASLIK